MGKIINHYEINEDFSELVLFCFESNDLINNAYSLNEAISKELIRIKEKRRSFKLESCIEKSIKDLPESVVIKDIDVLFNPNYQVDVLKILINIYKRKKFSVIWPGTIDHGKLIYAENKYRDYKEFVIDNYDVICLV